MITAASETRRIGLWNEVSKGSVGDIEPARLRELRIYGGAQGIWVDKSHTASPDIGAEGATVSVLHTGRHYADDLSNDGVIYHYPKTSRPPARDQTEILATKNAMDHRIPIFVVLPGASKSRRSLKLGWVCDFDDNSRQFLILFGDEHPPTYYKAETVDAPFVLEEKSRRKVSSVLVRVGQQQFRFHVLAQYGLKCAVCDIRHPQLLTAAHIRGKAHRGTDDWRNGLPLCATHHGAFDTYLFAIHPGTRVIQYKPGVAATDIGVRETNLNPSKSMPHADALLWRWREAQKEWSISLSGEP